MFSTHAMPKGFVHFDFLNSSVGKARNFESSWESQMSLLKTLKINKDHTLWPRRWHLMKVPRPKEPAVLRPPRRSRQGQKDWALGSLPGRWLQVRAAGEDCPPAFQVVTDQQLSPSALTQPWFNIPPPARSVGSQLSAPIHPELPLPKH